MAGELRRQPKHFKFETKALGVAMVHNRLKALVLLPQSRQLGEPQRSERRERRSPLAVLLQICGFSASGRIFSEVASTRNISRSGCCIRLRNRPLGHTALAVRVVPREGPVPQGGAQMLYEVAWQQPQGQLWDVGLFALTGSDLLQVAFGSNTP